MEVYNGVPIIYSLGNTVFDQDWSQETSEGLIIAGEFRNNTLTLQGVPIEILRGKPHIARETSQLRIFERIGFQLSATVPTSFAQPGSTIAPQN
jgi:poly-gamma-glutamate synthesis protein (capsule biosynthesis protein)